MNMENSKKTEIVKSILSKTDFLEMENHILSKQNQAILDKLHEEAQEGVKSIFNEEQQRWMDDYIKEHNLDPLLEMLDID